jgi:hypothetical protein
VEGGIATRRPLPEDGNRPSLCQAGERLISGGVGWTNGGVPIVAASNPIDADGGAGDEGEEPRGWRGEIQAKPGGPVNGEIQAKPGGPVNGHTYALWAK